MSQLQGTLSPNPFPARWPRPLGRAPGFPEHKVPLERVPPDVPSLFQSGLTWKYDDPLFPTTFPSPQIEGGIHPVLWGPVP